MVKKGLVKDVVTSEEIWEWREEAGENILQAEKKIATNEKSPRLQVCMEYSKNKKKASVADVE